MIENSSLYVFSSIVVFSIIIVFLSFILNLASKKLLPQGDIKILVNNKDEMIVKPGSTLLSVLSDQNIFLPSACGGCRRRGAQAPA